MLAEDGGDDVVASGADELSGRVGVNAGVAADPLPALPELHAPSSIAQDPRRAAHLDRLTPPECHVTPMRIRGCAAGVSQRMIVTRFDEGIDTHPAVAFPSVTCRKKALPA